MFLNYKLKILSILIFILINLILFFLSFNKFPGQIIYFITLFIITNLYLFYSYKHSKLFLDKTLSIFLWLGFFYKLSILLITDSGLPEGRGNFSYLPEQYDVLLLYSSLGIGSFFLSSFVTQKYLTNFLNLKINFNQKEKNILIDFYSKYKSYLCLSFFILVLIITILNLKLGFYQKGLLPKSEINIFLGYLIKWMLLFGLTSISCLLLEYDIKKYNNISLVVIFLFFLELFMTNFSLLSRSLIFSGSAILMAIFFEYQNNVKKKFNNSLLANLIILFFVFIISIFPINKIRNSSFIDQSFIAEKIVENNLNNIGGERLTTNNRSKDDIEKIIESDLKKDKKIELVVKNLEENRNQNLDFKKNINRILFVIKNRFVGLDGVATVTSYPDKNKKLFTDSLKVEYNSKDYGFYQKTFIIPFEQKHLVGKQYMKTSQRHYGVILPGIIAFLSYSGSKIFLFISGLFVFMFCGIIELMAKKLSYNSIIFSSFIGYVLGYRLIHFGYLPKQSYLIVTAILITILIIFSIKKTIIKSFDG